MHERLLIVEDDAAMRDLLQEDCHAVGLRPQEEVAGVDGGQEQSPADLSQRFPFADKTAVDFRSAA